LCVNCTRNYAWGQEKMRDRLNVTKNYGSRFNIIMQTGTADGKKAYFYYVVYM